MMQNLDERAIDYLASQIWERLDGSSMKYWAGVKTVEQERYRQYVRDIIAKENSL